MRPAYRSREAGKEAHRPWPRPPVRLAAGTRDCRLAATECPVIAPPLPRSSAIVDPRVGDNGPALLALEDGLVFPGISFGAPAGRRWRPGRQHESDGLPGGLHRPLLCRPARRDDVSADRQLRPPPRGRPVGAAVAPRTDRRQRDGRGRRAGRPAGGAAAHGRASRRSPAWTRARWRGICGRVGSVKGADRGARRARPRRGRRGGAERSALGGPGFRGRGLAGEPYDVGEPADGGPLDRHRRPRAQEQHRPQPPPARGACARAAAHGVARGGARVDLDGLVLSPGPGDPARLRRPGGARSGRDRARADRCSGSASGTRSSASPRAPRRGGCASATTVPTIRSRMSTRARSRSRRRTTR